MRKKKVYIAGDSTACIYPHFGEENQFPRTGWGQVIDRFLPEFTIVDLALSGRSSKSFRTEENYKYLCDSLSAGDYLIIQFGHNDSKDYDPERYTAPNGEYQESLMEYVRLARRKGAAPILATSISRNRPSDASLEKYVEAVRQLANTEAIPLIDMYAATNTYINRVGTYEATQLFMNVTKHDERFMSDLRYEGSEYYDKYTIDNTHLNINGALFIAEFVADMMHEILDR